MTQKKKGRRSQGIIPPTGMPDVVDKNGGLYLNQDKKQSATINTSHALAEKGAAMGGNSQTFLGDGHWITTIGNRG